MWGLRLSPRVHRPDSGSEPGKAIDSGVATWQRVSVEFHITRGIQVIAPDAHRMRIRPAEFPR
jgi:hypothetical protein